MKKVSLPVLKIKSLKKKKREIEYKDCTISNLEIIMIPFSFYVK
jgi:hypothetical protein